MSTQIIAHRGASADAPENTLPAFELARAQGAHMIEFDVRVTGDGQIVVFHDETTERWNNQPWTVAQISLAELQRVDLRGASAPTLHEVCAWARTTPLQLNIEIKVPGIEANVVQIVQEHNLEDRIIVSSFAAEVLMVMRQVAPRLARGVLMGTQSLAPGVRLREAWPLPVLRQYAANAWHPAWQLPLLDWLIPRIRRAGYVVNVWTVDDPQVMERLLALGVDGIMTNRPDLLREVIDTWQARQNSV